MAKWIGIAALRTGGIVAVNIDDTKDTNMPFGNTDWLEAIEGDASALAVVEVGENPMTVDCATDTEAPNFYHTY